ncbi:hypothetical protein [Polymorphospora lycopeni]|uniref:Uncharacterized protein n=1 Tax=Polymorphospora lycopeni TaxID=3140240 RepID=A0ABV5CKV4_9ACTN
MADKQTPQAAVIEVVEKRSRRQGGDGFAGVIVPNEIRLNGQTLLAPKDPPVRLHEVTLDDQSLVLATLTLFVRRLTVDIEEPEATDE